MGIPQFLSTPNPIPLPEILLLDDAEEPKSIVEEESTQNEEATNIEKVSKENTEAEVAVLTETNTSINSPLKKRSNNDLTISKLVEMINSELQDKVDLNDSKVRSCEKVAVALPTIELPKDDVEKEVDDVADVEIVTLKYQRILLKRRLISLPKL